MGIEHVAHLTLANGARLDVVAGDDMASIVVSRLMEVMQLEPVANPLAVEQCSGLTLEKSGAGEAEPAIPDPARRLCIRVDADGPAWPIRRPDGEETVLCVLRPPVNGELLGVHLMRVALAIALSVQRGGGLLLHGALAERNGVGVILAGYGGAGKTTASQRLPPPWRSLCDDTTLIVRDGQGAYWAHPWPTWSKLLLSEQDGTWDVQHAVPLRGIFFLNQSEVEKAEPVGVGQAASSLVEATEQASGPMSYGRRDDVVRELRLERFDHVCALAQAVPCYLLNLSLTGAFWQEVERALVEMNGDRW